MPTAIRPTATRSALAAVLQFPYSTTLVESLKREIPAYGRSYDPETRSWLVREPYCDRAIWLLRQVYPDAVVVEGQGEAPPRPPRRETLARADHLATLHLLPGAPPEVAQAAYRALVKLHHPDHLPPGERERGRRAMLAIEALRADGAA